jgi:hypothetical protein
VTRGTVKVYDRPRHSYVQVHAPGSYLITAPRG